MPSACLDILFCAVHQYEMTYLKAIFCLRAWVACTVRFRALLTTPDEDLPFYIWRIGRHDQIDFYRRLDPDSAREAFDY